jgi:conserved hypothetical protein, YceG family
MNKNPNNDPRRRGQQNRDTKVYKSQRPVNTSEYRSTHRAVKPSPYDATRIMPVVKQDQQPTDNNNTVYRHDPNQLYKVPPPDSIADNSSTQTIPVVKPQRNQSIRPPKYTGNEQDNSRTQVIPVVKSQQYQQQPQRQHRPQQQYQPPRNVTRVQAQANNQQSPDRRRNSNQPANRRQNVNRNQPRKNQNSQSRSMDRGNGAAPTLVSNVMKAVIYIVAVLVFSGFLALYIIIVANDVFAFNKTDIEMDVTISEYDNTSDIANKLHDFGIIKYPSIFRLYAKLRDQDDNYVGGTYTISPSMNYDQLFIELKGRNIVRDEISITIREGWTVDNIIDLFVSKDMGTRSEFVNVINTYDFDYWFVDELTELSPDRTYRLEGYLFPDTYYFYTDASEIAIIDKLLSNFNRKFVTEYREYIAGTQYSVDDMVILASLIQAEARYVDEYADISSVFHNRLENPGYEYIGGRLQCDATIQYFLTERKEDLTVTDLETDNPYNTRIYAGLPPGPIGNPSLNAIHSALDPADTDYYYFVSYPGGRSEFAATNAEHEANKLKVSAAVIPE